MRVSALRPKGAGKLGLDVLTPGGTPPKKRIAPKPKAALRGYESARDW